MSTFKVEGGIEHYRIVGPNGEEGERVPYGTIATLEIGVDIYFCNGKDPDAEEYTLYRVNESQEVDAITEDIIFDDEEGDDPDISTGEDDEEEEDGEEEDEEVGPELVK